MERIALAAILIITLAAVARFVWRSARSARQATPGACSGCPFAGDCGGPSARRADGADHGR